MTAAEALRTAAVFRRRAANDRGIETTLERGESTRSSGSYIRTTARTGMKGPPARLSVTPS